MADSEQALLQGVHVVEFAHYVPTPLVGHWLAAAGARVTRVEHPERRDPLRDDLRLDPTGGRLYQTLNAAKERFTCDLRLPDDRQGLRSLLAEADVFLHQLRPGRLAAAGFGPDALQEINPALIAIEMSAGQTDGAPDRALHDLNVVAELGLLDRVRASGGEPILPHVLLADVAGASMPLLTNVMAALYRRQRTGRGAHLQLSMRLGLAPFLLWPALESLAGGGARLAYWGESPRYNLYPLADGGWLAFAALEDAFWRRALELAGLDSAKSPEDDKAVREWLGSALARLSAEEIDRLTADPNTCCSRVVTAEAGVAALAQAFAGEGEFGRVPGPLASELLGGGTPARRAEARL